MTTTNDKLRSLFLAALMVFSVFAGTVAFSGATAAATVDRGAGNTAWETGGDGGDVGDGATIFQGEGQIDNFVGSNDETYSHSQLERTAGSDEGVPLSDPIDQDQARGSYDTSAEVDGSPAVTVTVAEPSINTFDINAGDNDISGGTASTGQNLTVVGEYNFHEAEDLEISVEDEGGSDVTDIVVDSETALNPNPDGEGDDNTVTFNLDEDGLETGEEYTVTIEGTEDLNFEDASQSSTFEVSSSTDPTLDLANDSATQGDNVAFDIEGANEGDYHLVTIDQSDFRDGIDASDAASTFRNVDDTDAVGIVDENGNVLDADADDIEDVDAAYATVEIDGGVGTSAIETQYLTDSSVDVELYDSPANDEDDISDRYSDGSEDDATLDVSEGDVSIDNPSDTYVAGSSVDVNGSATSGMDEVAIYVRDNSQWQPLDLDGDSDNDIQNTIDVDGDDTFEQEDVDLTAGDGQGSNILSFEGSYRIGVIDASDVDNTTQSLSTSDFNSGTSNSDSVRVTGSALEGEVQTVNGQIATEDARVDINGTAAGESSVSYVFIGPRGGTVVDDVSVDDDDTFSEEDIDISGLSQGVVSAHMLVDGRDNAWGDGGEDDIGTILDGTGARSGDQVRSVLLSNTVDETASDDLMVNRTFQLTDGVTSINSVYPEEAQASGVNPVASGETMVVEGETNIRPDDNTITVEVLDESGDSMTLESTDSWSMSNGTWTVGLDTSDLEPGTYTVEADDGENSDRTDIEIVEEREDTTTETDTDGGEDDTETTPTAEPDTESPTDTEESPDDTETPTPTDDSGPGFTIVAALGALIAAALLAVRRNN